MLFKKKDPSSSSGYAKEITKERLKNILMRDRVETSREIMGSVKTDLVMVASEYFVLSERGAEVYLTNMQNSNSEEERDQTVLVALIPIEKVRRETFSSANETEDN